MATMDLFTYYHTDHRKSVPKLQFDYLEKDTENYWRIWAAADMIYLYRAGDELSSRDEEMRQMEADLMVRNMMIQELTGDTLQVLKCTHCDVKFVIDKKPVVPKNGYCPLCGSDYYVKVDKDALEILKEDLVELKKFQVKIMQPKLINKGKKK